MNKLSKNIVEFNAQLDNNYFLKDDKKQELYLYINLKAGKLTTQKERIPLNIALVIDRSGSMAGQRLEYVKKATDFVIDNLNASDILSIVQYDSQVDVLSASSKVNNKKKLHDLVRNIRAGGTTNLSGGMLEGYNQVDAAKADNFVNRVLLLSDGLANNGITDPNKLQEIAQKKFRSLGIGLSTFGVGNGFNESLMTNLAEYGGANYYFIESPDEIPNIFAKELEGLLSVVAQNAKLSIQIPRELACKKVYGYPAQINSNSIEVSLNDIFSEEEKAILIQFDIKESFRENLVFKVAYQYDDAAESYEHVSERSTLSLQVTTDKPLYEQAVNPLVAQNICLFVANDYYEQALQLVDSRKFEQAKKLIAKAIAMLEATLKLFPTSEELKTQLVQVKAYESKIEEMKNYDSREFSMAQKSSKMSNYLLRKKRK